VKRANYNPKRWERVYMKVGTLPGLHYFVAKADVPNLLPGNHVKVRIDDLKTKPEFQHERGVMVEEIRQTRGGPLIVGYLF
jgi:hypothetical protein